MKFFQPHTVSEAVGLAQRPGMVFLAGGTDLVLKIREGKIRPDGLIDLSAVPELQQISLQDDILSIGSMVTFSALSSSALVKEHARALWLACQTMGSPPIRNQATIGGNLGNCSPAADGLPPLLALGALVHLTDIAGDRLMPLAELLQNWPMPQGTLITGFSFPVSGWRSGFAKLGRRQALAIARLSIAVAVRAEGSRALDVRVAFGAVGVRAFLSDALATVLTGREITGAWLEEANLGARSIVRDALGDRASASYKRVAAGGVMRQAIQSIGLPCLSQQSAAPEQTPSGEEGEK